jgi:uncharacterized phage-like protein YoqJ
MRKNIDRYIGLNFKRRDNMTACTFIGHKNAGNNIREDLKNIISNLIENNNVKQFYVGNHGNFDYMVQSVLKELSTEYTKINYNVVLAYIPEKKSENVEYENSIYPDGLEYKPPKFAIIERNKWMIKNSDYLVCYVKNTVSNAYKFKEYANKKGKFIIEL